MEFRETERVALDRSIKSPANLCAIVNADGSCDLAFEMSNGSEGPGGSTWTEEWRPFNSSGIAAGERRYRYLAGATLRGGEMESLGQITATQREVYHSMCGLTPISLGAGHERDWVTGSHQGNLVFYHNRKPTGFDLEMKRHIAGEDGNALRHPTINPSVCAYPQPTGLVSDLIACGEGSLYFYKFTGKFTAAGAPIYLQPASVLEENADLYAGTLPRDIPGNVIANQLMRSASSVGANYRSACRAWSKAEFLAKLGVVLEEADESGHWLELIIDDGMLSKRRVEPLRKETDERCAIIYSAINTGRNAR